MSQDFMEKYIQSLEDQIALYKRQTSSQQEELVLLRQKVKVLEGELNASLAQSKSQQVCHESKSIHTTNTATSNHVVHHATVDGYAKRKRSETISPTEMQNSFEVATSLVSLPKAGGLYSHPPSHNNSRAPSPVDNVGPKEIYSFSTSQGLDYSNMAGTTGSSSYIPGIGRKLPRLLPHSDSFGHRSTVSVPQIINESKYAHSSAVNPPSHRATASMSSLRQIESIKSLGPACEGCRVRKRKCGRERPHCSYCVKIHRNKSGPVQCSYSTATSNTPNTRTNPQDQEGDSNTKVEENAKRLSTPPLANDDRSDESEKGNVEEEKKEGKRTVTPPSAGLHSLLNSPVISSVQ